MLGNEEAIADLTPEISALYVARFGQGTSAGRASEYIDPRQVREMLDKIDPDPSHDEWFRVAGKGIVRMVAMTDFGNEEAVRQLHRRLSRMGVLEKLREEGAEEGDTVRIGDYELEYVDE